MNLTTWYKGLRIPRFNENLQMKAFATSMVSAFSITAGKTLDVSPQFFLTEEIETAAIDLEKLKVFIGLNILNGDSSKRPNPTATEESALTTIFGMVFHESMHFIYTSRNTEKIAKKLGVENEQLFATISNICEDYYIDDVFIKTMTQYAWTYEERFNYFFSVSKANDNFKAFLSQPTSANFLRVMISLKNPAARSLLKKLAPEHLSIAQLALSVMNEHDRELRPHIAYEVYKLLLENTDESTQQEQQASEEEDAEEALTQEKLTKLKESEETIEIDCALTMCNSGESNGGVIEIVPSKSDLISTTLGTHYMPSTDKMTVDTRYYEFAKILKLQSETATYWTPPSNHGRHIRSVSRIATDNKLFSTKIVEQGIGPQEILILIDCSGSMTSRRNIWRALEAAYAAASSLESARHSVAVYGHSADHDTIEDFASTTIYRFKGFNETFASVKHRFEYFYSNANCYLSNNDDEIAISEVSKRFTPARNKKTLIVISDGQPAARRCPDISSTAKAVAAVRSKGIGVISISIEKGAVPSNDRIYGKDNNVSNEDPNVVMEVIRKIAQF